MDQKMIMLVAVVMACLAPAVRGTFHLSFSNNTEVNITRSGCGSTKLCVETPTNCDPASSPCLFSSFISGAAMAPNGSDLAVELRGDSAGFIALGLTVNASEGTTMVFVCAQNNGTFFFRTRARNNSNSDGALTPTERLVNEIRGAVNGSVIKCEFTIPSLNATARTTMDTSFTVLLGSGTTTGTELGAFSVNLDAGLLNLADPASNAMTTAAPQNVTTAQNMTTSAASAPTSGAIVLLSVATWAAVMRT
ncbi:uncharacterized protein ACJ7VT_017656 [Polymixia lowei]